MLGGVSGSDSNHPISGNVIRMNPSISPKFTENKPGLPEGIEDKDFRNLVDLEMDAVENENIELIKKYCEAWIRNDAPNQVIRGDAKSNPFIGHATFGAAKAAWEDLIKS